MRNCIGLVLLVVVWLSLATAQQNKPESKPSPAATPQTDSAHPTNPVKPTSESLASGKKYYGYDCAMCHGENGDGKGEVAVEQKLDLKDFRDPETLKGRADGDLFNLLKKGHANMPPEKIRVTPNELWNLINYVRSLAGTK